MKEIFVFSDWTSISQVKNSIDPDLKVSCTAIIDRCGEDNEIVGYDLTVYLKSPYVILYKVKVESGKDHVWSLNTNEAVEFLNTVGFYCEYKLPPYAMSLTEKQVRVLKSLEGLDYTHIVRNFANGRGSVIAMKSSTNDTMSLSTLSDYNYLNWVLLPIGRPQVISSLLEGNALDQKWDCGCNK